jgi:signal transduction histidine kinase
MNARRRVWDAGLFSVREIVLGHGGTFAVESTAEAGPVLTVRLPRPPA